MGISHYKKGPLKGGRWWGTYVKTGERKKKRRGSTTALQKVLDQLDDKAGGW